ncbi:hypothetical protein G7Z17_g2087 [Cylindrodendrum hubeiense]|uniref:Uncharacterized protein n=1 Tax=Cylindrodendrum hubeiense TaxID=595255 RepID=A0A9P5LBY3_9HYPO|nr:hypothetical protein G7Z17_g2087 [Cylindrodendrum hubeiense]
MARISHVAASRSTTLPSGQGLPLQGVMFGVQWQPHGMIKEPGPVSRLAKLQMCRHRGRSSSWVDVLLPYIAARQSGPIEKLLYQLNALQQAHDESDDESSE